MNLQNLLETLNCFNVFIGFWKSPVIFRKNTKSIIINRWKCQATLPYSWVNHKVLRSLESVRLDGFETANRFNFESCISSLSKKAAG